jgi:hypothetical protein
LTRITKDCFGMVISSLKKMKECVRCELLRECRAINWPDAEGEAAPVVVRRSGPSSSGNGDPAGGPAAGDPSSAGHPS